MSQKLTKRDYFNQIKAMVAGNDELVAFVDHEIELLNKKNSAPRKATPKQLENVEIGEYLVAHMEAGKGYTVTQLIKEVLGDTDWAGIAGARVTPILGNLVKAGKVANVMDHRKSIYTLVD